LLSATAEPALARTEDGARRLRCACDASRRGPAVGARQGWLSPGAAVAARLSHRALL